MVLGTKVKQCPSVTLGGEQVDTDFHIIVFALLLFVSWCVFVFLIVGLSITLLTSLSVTPVLPRDNHIVTVLSLRTKFMFMYAILKVSGWVNEWVGDVE